MITLSFRLLSTSVFVGAMVFGQGAPGGGGGAGAPAGGGGGSTGPSNPGGAGSRPGGNNPGGNSGSAPQPHSGYIPVNPITNQVPRGAVQFQNVPMIRNW